jgi:Tryptophan-rich protein (DUF2389)
MAVVHGADRELPVTVQRKFLQGSRWTATTPLEDAVGARHFEIISVGNETVMLRPVIGGPTIERVIRDLEDKTLWTTGWLLL